MYLPGFFEVGPATICLHLRPCPYEPQSNEICQRSGELYRAFHPSILFHRRTRLHLCTVGSDATSGSCAAVRQGQGLPNGDVSDVDVVERFQARSSSELHRIHNGPTESIPRFLFV